jgi:hypothetical protein
MVKNVVGNIPKINFFLSVNTNSVYVFQSCDGHYKKGIKQFAQAVIGLTYIVQNTNTTELHVELLVNFFMHVYFYKTLKLSFTRGIKLQFGLRCNIFYESYTHIKMRVCCLLICSAQSGFDSEGSSALEYILL